MVSRELFTKTVQRFRNTYNRQDFLTDIGALKDWYDAFEKCSEWAFKKAVDETLKECKFLPVLAEVYTRYEEYEHIRRQYRSYFIQEWDSLCYEYPNGSEYKRDKECCQKIQSLTTDKCDGDYEEGTKLLKRYLEQTKRYVATQKNLPDFKDYIMGLE